MKKSPDLSISQTPPSSAPQLQLWEVRKITGKDKEW